ncbi:beta strand repeat-containing protein [Spiribacter pallidus]|uniref:YDG domain-containing protein n=1 Tax=Spiribacter pallidus TaxID=1987936 RepID=A0ABV3TCK3_9GAMM
MNEGAQAGANDSGVSDSGATDAQPDPEAFVVMRPDIRLAGEVDVTSETLGGEVTLRAEHIQLEADSSIDARGGTGGGQVHLDASAGEALRPEDSDAPTETVSRIQAAGRINVSSGGGKGGRVKIEGEDIELEATAEVDASGATAGGEVLVGGDWQGGANEARRVLTSAGAMRTAARVDVAAGAEIDVSATDQGDGGTAVVWADGTTAFNGHVSARGAGAQGDGGFTEVSGKRLLDFRGTADLLAPAGEPGVLLLDPTNLEIRDQQAGNNITRENDIWEPGFPGVTSVLTVSQLQMSLSTSNVIVRTIGSGGTGEQAGHITVVDRLDGVASDNLLHLQAAGDIRFDADVVSDGNLQLWADADGAVIQGAGHYLGTSASPLKDVRLTAAGQTTGGVGIRTDNIHANHLELETQFGDVEQNVGSRLDSDEVVLTGSNQAAFNLDEDNRIGKFAGQVVGGDVTLRNTIDLVVDNTLTTNIGRNSLRPALRTAGGNVTIEATQNVSGVHINTRSNQTDPSSAAGDITIRLTADDADMSLGGAAGSARTMIFGGLDHIKAENGTTTFSTTGNNSDLLVGGFSAPESAEMGDIVFSAGRDLLFQGGDSNLSGGVITLKAGREIKFTKDLTATTVVAEAKTTYLEEAGISAGTLSFRDDLAITLPDYADSDTPANVDLSTTDNANPHIDLRGTLTVDAPKSAVRVQARNASAASNTVRLGDVDAANLEFVIDAGHELTQVAGKRIRAEELMLVGAGSGGKFELTGDNVIDDLAGNAQGPVTLRHDATVSGVGSGLVIKPVTGGVSGITYRGLTTNDHDFAVTTEKNFSFASHLNEILLDAGSGTVTIKDGTSATSNGIALGNDNRTNLSIGAGLAQITAAKTVFDTRVSGNPIYVNGVNHTGLGAVTFLSGGTLDFIGNVNNPTVVHGDLTAETPGLLTVLENIESKGSMQLSADSIFVGENNPITLTATGTDSNLTLDAPVTWDSRELQLKAGRDIRLEGRLDGRPSGSGATDGALSLRYGLASADGVENGRDARLRIHAPVRLPAGPNFSEKIGSGGNLDNYIVITTLGSAGSTTATDLQGMAGNLTRNYALGSDIDASPTASWNGGKGFDPIGDTHIGFSRNFHGLGNRIHGLTIHRPSEARVGLFAFVSGTKGVSHLHMSGVDVAGDEYVGGVAGMIRPIFRNNVSTTPALVDVHIDGIVAGRRSVGALAGHVESGGGDFVSINRSSSAGLVSNGSRTSSVSHGGLVGYLVTGVIDNSFSSTNVVADSSVGGLAGSMTSSGEIANSYAAGFLSARSADQLGAVTASSSGTVTNAFGRNVANPYSQSTYGTQSGGTWSGFDFDDTWTMVDGETRPLLRSERSSRIANARQLQLLRVAPARDYKLANDINLTDKVRANKGIWRDGFVPAGDAAAEGAFTGALDGNSKTLTGLLVNRDSDLTDGLLGDANGGSVSNLILNNVDLTSGDGQGGDDGDLTLGAGVTLTGNVNLDAGTGTVSVSNAIGTTGNPAKAVSIGGADISLPAVTTESAQTYNASGTITAAGDLISQSGATDITANQVQLNPNQAFTIDVDSLTVDAPVQQLGTGGVSFTADAIAFSDTIQTRGGSITLTARDGGITTPADGDSSPADLRTRATANSGQASGNIILDAENVNDSGFISVGSLNAAGADNNAGAGSHGGDLTLKSDGGLSYTSLTVGGGDGAGASGGDSGDIILQTDGAAGISLPAAPLRAIGGSGSTAGSDGVITLEARGNGGITQPADGAEIRAQRLNLASHTTSSPLTSLTGEIALADADNQVDVLGVNTFKGTGDVTGQTLRFVNQGDLTLKGWRSSGFHAEGLLDIDVGTGHLTLDAAIQSAVGGLTATGGNFTATSNATIDYSAPSSVDLNFSGQVEIDAPIETGGGDLGITGSRVWLTYEDGDAIVTDGGNVTLSATGNDPLYVSDTVKTSGGDFTATGFNVSLASSAPDILVTSGGDVTLTATDNGQSNAESVYIDGDVSTGGGNFTSSGHEFFIRQYLTGSSHDIHTAGGDIDLNGHDGLVSVTDMNFFDSSRPGFYTFGGSVSATNASQFSVSDIDTGGNSDAGSVSVSVDNSIFVDHLDASATNGDGGPVTLQAAQQIDIDTIDTSGVNQGGAVILNGPVDITGTMSVTTGATSGDITFNKRIRKAANSGSTPADLTLKAGSGSIVFKKPVGGNTALRSVFIEQAAAVTAEDLFRAERLAVRASGNLNFTDSANDFDTLALDLTGNTSASIVDQDALEIGSIGSGSDTITGITAAGAANDISLTVGGALTQAAGATVITPGTLAIDTTAFDAADVTLRNDAAGGTVLGDSLIAGTLSIDARQDDVRQASGDFLRAGKLLVTNHSFELDMAEEQFFANGIVAPGLSYFSAADSLTVTQGGNDITVTEVNGTGSLVFDGSQAGKAFLVSDSLDRGISAVTSGSAVQLSEANAIDGEIQITTAGQYSETAVTQGDGSISLAAITSARDFTLKAPGDINIDAGAQLTGALSVDSGHTARLKANGNNTIAVDGDTTIKAEAQVRVGSGVRLTSNGGDIALTATGQASHSGVGVRLRANTSAAGLNEATALITSGAGTITISGQGGGVSDTTNAGVRIGSEDAGDVSSVLLQTAGGDLSITGTGGLWNADSATELTQVAGVDLRSGTYRTTAGGAITVSGTGPTGLAAPANTGYGDRDGVVIENHVLIDTYVANDSALAGDYGAISITGTAYGTGEGIDGNDDTSARTIRAGKGGVTLTGVLNDQPNGGAAGGRNGVVLRKFEVDARGGAVSLTGEGGSLGGDGLRAYENSTLGSSQTTALSITGLARGGTGDGVDLDRTAVVTSGALTVSGTAVDGQGIEISDQGSGSGSTTLTAGDITLEGRSTGSKGLKIIRMDGATATGALTLKAESATGDRAIDIREADFSAASATFGGIDTPYAAAQDEGIFFDDSRLITTGAITLKGEVTENDGVAGILLDWDKDAIDSKLLVKGQSISLEGQSAVSAPGIEFDQRVELETTGGPVTLSATSAAGTPSVSVRDLSINTAGGDLGVTGKTDLPLTFNIDTTGSGTDGSVTFADAVDGAGSMIVDAGGAAVSFQDDFTADTLTLTDASQVDLAGSLQVSRIITAAQNYSIALRGADNRFGLLTNFHNTGGVNLGDSAADVFLFNGGMKVTGTSNPVSLHGILRASASGGSSPGEDLDLLGAAVTLAGASTLDLTNNGNTTPGPEDDILIGSVVGGGGDYARDLTMIAGGGDIVVNNVGDATKIGDVTVDSARTVAFYNLSTIGRFTQKAGTGATIISGSPSFAADSGAPAFDFSGNQLFFTTGGPQAGTSDILIDAVDLQIDGAMDAKGLSLQVQNTPFLGAAPHAVDRLAASLTGDGASLGFKAAGALTVANVGGVNGVSTNDGTVTLQADALGLDKAVNAGAGTVTLRPGTDDRAVALGNQTGGDRLELSQAELNRITAGKLVIGSDSTGDVVVNAPDTGPDGTVVGDWVLSGSSLAQSPSGSLGFSGGLRLDVDGPVFLGTNANDVDALAGSVGTFSFTDADDLAIASVDGTDGLTATGAVTLVANTLSINESIDTASAPNAMTADITLTGPTDLAADLATAGADITLGENGAVHSLSGGARTISTGSGPGDITLVGTLDGAETLSLKAGTGDIALAGDVGGSTALTSLNVVDGNDLALSGVTTAGPQTYTPSGIITLGGMLTTAGSAITLNRAIELSGAAGIDTTDGGARASGTAINVPQPVTTKTGETSSFSVDVGTSNLSLNAVATTGAQHYTAQAITLAGDLSTEGAGVTLQGPVAFDGIEAIDTTAAGAVQPGGDVLFHGAAAGSADMAITATGGRVQLLDVTAGSINVTADTIDLAGEDYVANTGDIALTGRIELAGSGAITTIDSAGSDGDITLGAVDDGDHPTSLKLDAGSGDITLTEAVGATAAPSGLDMRAAGINTGQPITVHTNGNIRVDNSGSALLGGVIAGSGVSLIKEGAGTLSLGSGNTLTGSTVVKGGTVSIAADSALGLVPSAVTNGHLTLDGGSLSVTSGFTLAANRGLKVDSGGGGIVIPDGETLVYNGNLRGAGPLSKTSPGVLRLTGNSTYSGPVTIAAGSVEVAPRDNRFRPLGSGAVTNNSDLFLDFETNAAFTQPLSGTGTLRIRYTRTGNALLLTNGTHSGGTEITGGVLLGNGTGRGRLGSGEVALKTANSRLTFQVNTNGETVFANRFTGPGSLRKKGNDLITLTGDNDYQGNTTISGGRLKIGDGGATGSLGQGAVSLDRGNLILDLAGDITLANRLEGGRHLVHRGSGTLTLTGRAAYTGRTHTPGGGSIVFRHDELPATSAFRASGQIILEPDGTDFNGAQVIDYGFEESMTGFTVGKPGTESDLTVAGGIDITGPVHLHGGGVAINAPIDTSGNALALHAKGSVTQTAAVAADTLALHGNESFNLTHAQNDLATLAGGSAGDELGSVALTNAGPLTIGAVNPSGVHATGDVHIETLSGDLVISEDIVTSSNSAEAIVLNAGRNADAGDPRGGNLILQGDPTISAGAQGIIRLYTGSIDGSIGVAESGNGAADGLIGYGSGRFRYGSDEQIQAFSLALSEGTPFAIYRERPSLTGVIADQALAYGETPAVVTATQLTGLENGDGFAGSVANQSTSTGGYLNAGQYQAVASGPAARGYNVSNITNGQVVVEPRALDVVNVTAPSRTYNGTTEAPLTEGQIGAGVLGGDLVTLDTSGASATFADANVAQDIAVMASGYTLAGSDAGNYTLQQPAGLRGEIRPRALTLRAVDRFKTAGETLDLGLTDFTIEAGELAGGERITAATLGSVSGAAVDPDAGVGEYPNEVSIADAVGDNGFMARNYAITYEFGDLSINPAPPAPSREAGSRSAVRRALTVVGMLHAGRQADPAGLGRAEPQVSDVLTPTWELPPGPEFCAQPEYLVSCQLDGVAQRRGD